MLAMSHSSGGSVSIEDVARELAPLGARVSGARSVRITGVRQDSRRVEAGELFCARAGRAAKGADFVAEALRRGARALLVEAGTGLGGQPVPVIEVSDVRRAIGLAAELAYGRPSRALELVGITGTNGKTTTSVLVEHALAGLGRKPARLGTLGFAFGAETDPDTLTTPEADDVSRYLARVVGRGATHFVMEVSSHALSLARVDALTFRVAAFTNLSQDHLDFYASLAEYGAAKARLFEALAPAAAVLNLDDAFGAALAARTKAPVIGVGRAVEALIRPLEATSDDRGVRARVATPPPAR
jgi:UDP-N-acetylmuramoyl-L-alanyl-D-glutamate--2,6-diaminopimelate ligase